jgi:hypothetical protein
LTNRRSSTGHALALVALLGAPGCAVLGDYDFSGFQLESADAQPNDADAGERTSDAAPDRVVPRDAAADARTADR